MVRRLPTKKILVATLGLGAVSYVVACSTSTSASGNLMAPQEDASTSPGDATVEASPDAFVSSGNLMAPDVGTAADVVIAADVSSSGNLMPPPPLDAGLDAGDGGD